MWLHILHSAGLEFNHSWFESWSLTTAGLKEAQDNRERGSQGSEKSEY